MIVLDTNVLSALMQHPPDRSVVEWLDKQPRTSETANPRTYSLAALRVTCNNLRILLGRSCRNKSSKDVALPHPQSRKDHYGEEDKPSCRGIVWKFFKRTINIAEYRNAKDDVNPAKNRTFGALVHDPPRFMTLEPP
jgi:hypothetical protein